MLKKAMAEISSFLNVEIKYGWGLILLKILIQSTTKKRLECCIVQKKGTAGVLLHWKCWTKKQLEF